MSKTNILQRSTLTLSTPLDEEQINIIICAKGTNQPRWNLIISSLEDGTFKVKEKGDRSLFDDRVWGAGKTIGEALDLFMEKEEYNFTDLGYIFEN